MVIVFKLWCYVPIGNIRNMWLQPADKELFCGEKKRCARTQGTLVLSAQPVWPSSSTLAHTQTVEIGTVFSWRRRTIIVRNAINAHTVGVLFYKINTHIHVVGRGMFHSLLRSSFGIRVEWAAVDIRIVASYQRRFGNRVPTRHTMQARVKRSGYFNLRAVYRELRENNKSKVKTLFVACYGQVIVFELQWLHPYLEVAAWASRKECAAFQQYDRDNHRGWTYTVQRNSDALLHHSAVCSLRRVHVQTSVDMYVYYRLNAFVCVCVCELWETSFWRRVLNHNVQNGVTCSWVNSYTEDGVVDKSNYARRSSSQPTTLSIYVCPCKHSKTNTHTEHYVEREIVVLDGMHCMFACKCNNRYAFSGWIWTPEHSAPSTNHKRCDGVDIMRVCSCSCGANATHVGTTRVVA